MVARRSFLGNLGALAAALVLSNWERPARIFVPSNYGEVGMATVDMAELTKMLRRTYSSKYFEFLTNEESVAWLRGEGPAPNPQAVTHLTIPPEFRQTPRPSSCLPGRFD